MNISSNGIKIELTIEEAIALSTMLGNMSQGKYISEGKVDSTQAELLSQLYYVLSDFVPIKAAT
jgi:hypothetical protein